MTIHELFDALMGELEGLDTGGAREIVGEIRKRLLTPEAVDGLPKEVCEAINCKWSRAGGYIGEGNGRSMARAVAAHLCVVRPEQKSGEATPWYASLHGGQWRYINTHHRDAISDVILLGPFDSLEEAIAAAKKSDENCGAVRREGEDGQFDPRPIISDASQATDEQRRKAFRSFCPPVELDIPEDIDEADLGYSFIRAALSAVRLDASDPRTIISDASQATEEQCRKAAAYLYPAPGSTDAKHGRTLIRAAISAVRLDASQKPVLTEAEVRAFDGVFERAEKHANSCGKPGLWRDELHTARAALARLKAGSAKLPHEMHPPFEGDPNQESFAKKPPLSSAEADKIIDKMLGECDCNEGYGPNCDRCVAVDELRGRLLFTQPAEAAEVDARIERAIFHIDLCSGVVCRNAKNILEGLRSRLTLKPRRLTDEERMSLGLMIWDVHVAPVQARADIIAAEVARLWGMPAPEHETPKVRRLSDEDADDLAGFAGDQLDSNKSLRADGHAIAAEVLRLLGLEYPS